MRSGRQELSALIPHSAFRIPHLPYSHSIVAGGLLLMS